METEKAVSKNYLYVEPERYSTDILAMLRSFYPELDLQVLVPESRPEALAQARESGFFCSVSCHAEEGRAAICLEGETLCFSFDPAKISEEKKGSAAAPDAEPAFKRELGRFFYELLAGRTGRSLPWGNLNGVRPTKPAFYGCLKGGEPEKIRAYYREEHFVSEAKTRLALEIAKREYDILYGARGVTDAGDSQAPGAPADTEKRYSLYIGIPFCPTTCLYCSFTSYPIAAYRQEADRYLEALLREVRAGAEQMRRRPESIYIGGGTPTSLSAEQLEVLLSGIEGCFGSEGVPLTEGPGGIREYTVEAGRADSITAEKLKVLKSHGVTRISVNPQTMHRKTLDLIGRRAGTEQVREAYALARQAGFDNINMDIILGLPGEGPEEVRETIRQVKEMAPDSLTVHSLALKRASGLGKWIEEHGAQTISNTEETMDIAAQGAKDLGLEPYYLYRQKNMSGNFENVGYAQPGKACYYNIVMMEEVESVLACGAGVISKRVTPGRDENGEPSFGIERCENPKDVREYLQRLEELMDRTRRMFAAE